MNGNAYILKVSSFVLVNKRFLSHRSKFLFVWRNIFPWQLKREGT